MAPPDGDGSGLAEARELFASFQWRRCADVLTAAGAVVSGTHLDSVRHGVWRSLVAHPLWERGAVGSNPATPTT